MFFIIIRIRSSRHIIKLWQFSISSKNTSCFELDYVSCVLNCLEGILQFWSFVFFGYPILVYLIYWNILNLLYKVWKYLKHTTYYYWFWSVLKPERLTLYYESVNHETLPCDLPALQTNVLRDVIKIYGRSAGWRGDKSSIGNSGTRDYTRTWTHNNTFVSCIFVSITSYWARHFYSTTEFFSLSMFFWYLT